MHDLPLGIRAITGQATCPFGAPPRSGHAVPRHAVNNRALFHSRTIPFRSLNAQGVPQRHQS